jgi:hypothetical protein
MNRVSLGFRVHSGWAAMVALTMEQNEPVVLRRERVQLVETFSYKFRQPYHTAEKLPFAKAQEFVSKTDAEAFRLGRSALRKLQDELKQQGSAVGNCGLLMASGRKLPELPKILASHALIHTADGELFREALGRASEECGVSVLRVKEKELQHAAEETLRMDGNSALQKVTQIGKPIGPPWSQDEKYAALVAWIALYFDAKKARLTGQALA